MAYQKLQVERALTVIPDDTIDIPNVAGPTVDSTMSSIPPTASVIVDDTQDFTTIVGLVGSTVIVGTGIARVATVDSATSITLDDAIAGAAAVPYTIYLEDTEGCVLYVGNTGNVRVLTAGNDDVTFVGIPAGAFVPVQVRPLTPRIL
jgi:hypothetical protein